MGNVTFEDEVTIAAEKSVIDVPSFSPCDMRMLPRTHSSSAIQ